MSYSAWCKSKDIRNWSDSLEARQKLSALVRMLVHATVESPLFIQFPADEGIQRRGWDGVLEVKQGNPWVPDGKSAWEMGTDQNPSKKADEDYTKRTTCPAEIVMQDTTFVFVTPRKWEGKTEWVKEKKAENKWRNVLAWDCDDLEQWLETAPGPDAWFARLLGKFPVGVLDLLTYWENLSLTSVPPLTADIFLAGRAKAKEELRGSLSRLPSEIVVSATSLSELRDFVTAVTAGSDEDNDAAIAARGVVVGSADAWSQLSSTRNRLLLIPSDQLELTRTMVAEAVKAGHHVMTQQPYTVVRGPSGIRLPRADRWDLEKALERAGFEDKTAARIARESGGCLTVLVRLASQFAGQAKPSWSQMPAAARLLPLVLIGSWNDANEEDRRLIEAFAGEPYAVIQEIATHWINQPDSPLRLVENVYNFVSREDSWQLLSPLFTKDLLNTFEKTAIDVLAEDDPRFEMPPGERYLAGIYKKLPKFSNQIRDGIAETIALLGTRGDHTPQGAPEGSAWRAGRVVTSLLGHATPQRWFSLAHTLSLLAEAAPDQFLSALEIDLQQSSPSCMALFEKNADSFTAHSSHTGLIWALRVLGWDTTHVSRVVLALAVLSKLDPGGRTDPRPASALLDIFRFWYPQTGATIDERLQILDLLARRSPDVAWPLFLGLMPNIHEIAIPSNKPRWRDCDTSQTRNINEVDKARQVEWAATWLIRLAERGPERWSAVLEHFEKLPRSAQNKLLEWFRAIDVGSIPEKTRLEIWKQVRDLVRKHCFFPNAWWALPRSTVGDLAHIESRFLPCDPIARSAWLFESGTSHSFGDIDMPFEERERLAAEAQAQAVRAVFEKLGMEGIFNLGLKSSFSLQIRIGDFLAKSMLTPDWTIILPDNLVSGEAHKRSIALGYAAARRVLQGDAWLEALPLEKWSAEAVGEFALALDFSRTTWQMLARRSPGSAKFYWRRVSPWVRMRSDDELNEAIKALLENGRPLAAIEALSMAIHDRKKPNWDTVADALELATMPPSGSSEAVDGRMPVWELCEVMKYLQADPGVDRSRLVALEWGLLPLARFNDFRPNTLHSELTQNAGFFAEVLAAVYRAKDEPAEEKFDSAKQRLAQAGHELLESWVGIPGCNNEGAVDENTLAAWVNEARRISMAGGRIEICDLKVGEQLSYAPADQDGSWPCKTVREVFETVTTDEIVRGFENGVCNQRGVTTRGLKDGGEQERELVKRYVAYAEKCKIMWPRTALALRRIAESYEGRARIYDEQADARY